MIGTALAIGQGLYGIYNAAKASNEANDYQAKMERMARQSPIQKESPELAEYYQQVSSRYKQNPFSDPYYLERIKQANRASANMLGQAQTRGAALALIPKINQGLMDASNRGISDVMQNKDRQLAQLGSAAQMRKSEQNQLFDINQMTPYNRVLQLQQLKTQAANDRYNAGLSMAAQGFGNLAQLGIADKMYNPKLKTQDETTATAISGTSPFKQVDLSSLPSLNNAYIPKTTLNLRQPFIGRTAQPSYFEKPIPYNYGRPALRDYTNMTLPY